MMHPLLTRHVDEKLLLPFSLYTDYRSTGKLH